MSMTNLASEFRDVLAVYKKLHKELTTIVDVKDTQSLALSILQHRDCLNQIALMSSRAAQLSNQWEQCRDQLDMESRREASSLAEAAKLQALHLLTLCQNSSQKLQVEHNHLQKDLAEIGKGARLIKGLKPAKNNYPKFIDSRY